MEKYYHEPTGKEFSAKVDVLRRKLKSQNFDSAKSKFGVAGNTFRAFTGYSIPPSKIYRDWAKANTEKLLRKKQFPELSSQPEFDDWHFKLFESLQEYWNGKQNRELSFAHTFKLVDLYLKWLTLNKECPDELVNAILKYGYCALDSQILAKLNECLSGALPIKRNPSMGDIRNKNTYDYCQSLIKEFSEKYGGTRLLFDFFAWEPGGANKQR